MKKSKILVISLFCFLSGFLPAQEVISYIGNDNYTLVERTNLRRYDNGKYTGLMSREVRSFLTQHRTSGGNIYYSGDFFVEQDTIKNSKVMFTGIHDAIPSKFFIDESGFMTMEEDNGYPSFRSFPSFPKTKLSIGDSWKGDSVRSIDPLNNDILTKIPMTIQYTYEGREEYHGEEVHRLSAQWATRYGITYWDFGGDKNLKSAQGSHKANILVSCRTGAMIFMTDVVDETFIYKDGNQITFKGTILQFTEYPTAVPHDEILPALKRIGAVAIADDKTVRSDKNAANVPGGNGITSADNQGVTTGKGDTAGNSAADSQVAMSGKGDTSGKNKTAGKGAAGGKDNPISKGDTDGKNAINDKVAPPLTPVTTADLGEKKITVQETDAGIRLAIHDLKFKPDSAELMPGETARLDEIAAVLKQTGSNKLLIEGFTADTGYPAGELKVSRDRAHAIAEALSKRGIDAGRFICKGSGAANPIADNSTPEGKAMNRRVEITILERNK
ncbi:MAG: OmpA family protein [Treponema sp.]|nr:OmpA family protein [Treponema sp.]